MISDLGVNCCVFNHEKIWLMECCGYSACLVEQHCLLIQTDEIGSLFKQSKQYRSIHVANTASTQFNWLIRWPVLCMGFCSEIVWFFFFFWCVVTYFAQLAARDAQSGGHLVVEIGSYTFDATPSDACCDTSRPHSYCLTACMWCWLWSTLPASMPSLGSLL